MGLKSLEMIYSNKISFHDNYNLPNITWEYT